MRVILLAFVIVSATSAGSAFGLSPVSVTPAPQDVIDRARTYIAERLGPAAAESFQLVQSGAIIEVVSDGPASAEAPKIVGWELDVRFRPWSKLQSECALQMDYTDGNGFSLYQIAKDGAYDVAALPDCVSDPNLCESIVDEMAAIGQAQAYGLIANEFGYNASIGFGTEGRGFVWRIRARAPGARYERVVVIDSGTGAVLSDYEDKPCSR